MNVRLKLTIAAAIFIAIFPPVSMSFDVVHQGFCSYITEEDSTPQSGYCIETFHEGTRYVSMFDSSGVMAQNIAIDKDGNWEFITHEELKAVMNGEDDVSKSFYSGEGAGV